MSIPIIAVTNQPERAQRLVKSAEKNGWTIHVLEREWKGFGTKIISTYEFLKQHPEIESFVFCDAHDVVVLGSESELINKIMGDKMILSTEKGLWPPLLHPFRALYDDHPKDNLFRYPNSGCYYSKSIGFIKWISECPPFIEIDDQYWLNIMYLTHEQQNNLRLDYFQNIFNSHSFIADGEYTYNNGRVQIMGNEPIFIHSNGGTQDPKLEELLQSIGL